MKAKRGKTDFYKFAKPLALLVMTGVVAACSTSGQKAMIKKTETSEYFSEAEYGVKASPRVALKSSKLPRGGGHVQIGKPYKVKGRWYYPKDVSSYSKTGKASWYGEAFHGRLTANGEIYDMTHLTAAHPTLPLPSYARVTNLENGSSIVVRVNDRGPFAKDRIIDLSKRAAQLLDYTGSGVTSVKVDYLGRAPLSGDDDSFLLASYRSGDGSSDPSDGLASGVMVAMNSSTGSDLLPAFGPILPDRPGAATRVASLKDRMLALSYAEQTESAAGAALERMATASTSVGMTIFAGTFDSEAEAERIRLALSNYGSASLESEKLDGKAVYLVTVQPTGGRASEALRHAWSIGASDAMIIRD